MSGQREEGRVMSVLLFVAPVLAAAVAIGASLAWRAWKAPLPHGGCYLF